MVIIKNIIVSYGVFAACFLLAVAVGIVIAMLFAYYELSNAFAIWATSLLVAVSLGIYFYACYVILLSYRNVTLPGYWLYTLLPVITALIVAYLIITKMRIG